MNELLASIAHLSLPLRLSVFAGVAISTHLVVILVRHLAAHLLEGEPSKRHKKVQSAATLTTSAVVFSLYFLAIGLILKEFGVSLTAYLASASVAGLAIGFGSQGVVQDVVTGLTFIFSDLIDVGDSVEISSQTGVVKAITMRFIELENAIGAAVFIPNRTISNVINYPRGYVRCIVDVTLRGDEAAKNAAEKTAISLMKTAHAQFPGILMTGPSSEGRFTFESGKEILRLKFRIWPGLGQPIETTFCQELIAELMVDDPDYLPWMIAISYEVEGRKQRPKQAWPWQRRQSPN